MGAEGSKGARSGRKLRQKGERRRREARRVPHLAYRESITRHILIEFFSRSGNAGISRRYYYIFRRYVASEISLSPSLFRSLAIYLSVCLLSPLSLSLFLFSPRRDNTLRDVFSLLSCRRGAAGRTYLTHYTCATLYPHSSLSLSPLRPRRIAVLRDILHISAYRPRRFRHCSLGPPPRLRPGRGIIPLVRRLPGPASRPDSSRFWYRACAG